MSSTHRETAKFHLYPFAIRLGSEHICNNKLGLNGNATNVNDMLINTHRSSTLTFSFPFDGHSFSSCRLRVCVCVFGRWCDGITWKALTAERVHVRFPFVFAFQAQKRKHQTDRNKINTCRKSALANGRRNDDGWKWKEEADNERMKRKKFMLVIM